MHFLIGRAVEKINSINRLAATLLNFCDSVVSFTSSVESYRIQGSDWSDRKEERDNQPRYNKFIVLKKKNTVPHLPFYARIVWSWNEAGSSWNPFSDENIAIIERAYNNNANGSVSLSWL